MKALAFTIALAAALLPESSMAVSPAAPTVTTQVLVTVTVPTGATHGVLTFVGVTSAVTSATVRFGPAGWTAKPLNAASGKGFTLDFKPKVAGSRHVTVCFGATHLQHVAFARGTWSFAPAMVLKPIPPKTVSVDNCLE
jgi:hypothetical protein